MDPLPKPEGDTVCAWVAGLSISPHCQDPKKPSQEGTGHGSGGRGHGGDGRVLG